MRSRISRSSRSHPALHALQLVLEPEHVLDAGEVEPELGRQPLDQSQPLEVGLGVEARVARRCASGGRAPSARRSAASAGACRRGRRRRRSCSGAGRPSRRLLPFRQSARAARPSPFEQPAIALRRSLLRSASSGTSAASSARQRRIALSALQLGARRWPRISAACRPPSRRGTFSETAPSGVGTSTSAPSAASARVTGTSTTRSAPRRS